MPHPIFTCESCVNNSSPLCEVCVTVNDGKPSHYIAHRDVHLIADKSSVVNSLYRCLDEGKPIPTAWVIAYNKEVERNGKKETL